MPQRGLAVFHGAGNVARLLPKVAGHVPEVRAEARALLTEAQERFREGPHEAGIANSLICIGDLDRGDRQLDAALALLGADLAKTEKFSTSLKDGLDIRETLRNWHTGELYVKVFPPQLGKLDCVLMFFDAPADPRDYPWRITWMAEHHDESTLALFATDYQRDMVGPGIGAANYGGAMFLFPPRPISDVWSDRRFDFSDTMEERLLAAACVYSECRHIAVLSEAPPGPGWRRLAKKHGKKLIHVPLGRFSQEKIQQLRIVHVLNGKHVRSYAAHFIRKA